MVRVWADGGVGRGGLRVPLRVPAQAGGEGGELAEGQLGVGEETQGADGGLIAGVAGDEGLLEAAWGIGEVVGERVVVVSAR